jgi:hypothetical protein
LKLLHDLGESLAANGFAFSISFQEHHCDIPGLLASGNTHYPASSPLFSCFAVTDSGHAEPVNNT